MFLDILGTVLLVALAVVLIAALAPAGEHAGLRKPHGVGIGAWFALAALLGVMGVFASPVLPVGVAVGIAVFAPVILAFGRVARTRGLGIPLTTLVAVHIGRILGVSFLLLYWAGRLPSTFAHSAGYGDIATGVLAIPLVWAIRHRVTGWRWFTGAWNLLGMADLLTAVVLAVGSAPGSLVRFIYETPGSGTVVAFPWVLIPAFFVPLYLLTHIAIFASLAASARASERPMAARAA